MPNRRKGNSDAASKQKQAAASKQHQNGKKQSGADQSNGAKQRQSHGEKLKTASFRRQSAVDLPGWGSCQQLSQLAVVSSFVLVLGLLFFGFGSVMFSAERTTTGVHDGGWRLADDHTRRLYDTTLCTIDRRNATDLTEKEFEQVYRYKRPVIVTFANGADGWIDSGKWTLSSLKKEYGRVQVLSGNSRNIVRYGGSGNVPTSFNDYVDRLMSDNDDIGEPFYVFDRDFYNSSHLPATLKPPTYFSIKDGVDDSIFFLGSSGSGVSFHKHADAWNGVIFGRKRWFLYMTNTTPPGGVYPGYTQRQWFEDVYPNLEGSNKPLECIQEPGEILYLPESTYHGTVNLGDTIAIGIQKRDAVTDVEKLFYKEHQLSQQSHSASDKKKQKLLKERLKVMLTVLSHVPDNSEVQMRIGELYFNLNLLDEAEQYLAKALQTDSYFLIAALNLAKVKHRMGDLAEAEHLYRDIIRLNPTLWDVYAQLGEFLIGQNRAHEAVPVFKKGTEVAPGIVGFWRHLKHAQELSGDMEAAHATQLTMDQQAMDY